MKTARAASLSGVTTVAGIQRENPARLGGNTFAEIPVKVWLIRRNDSSKCRE
jgi:hypothetical protein